jgi:ATP-dependent DNA helicase RecQ
VRAADETIQLLEAGKSFDEIAQARGRRRETVVNMVADLVEKGRVPFHPSWVAADRTQAIEAACAKLGTDWLKPLKAELPPEYSYDDIRLIVARLRREKDAAAEPVT